MEVLLDHLKMNPPIGKILKKIGSTYTPNSSMIELLLKRNLVDVHEWMIETFAGTFKNLKVLLSHKPDVPITHKAILRAACSVETMRLILDANGNNLPITEDIMVAAARSGQAVLEAILYRRGSLLVTEKVIREAWTHGFSEAAWLLQ
ncbi:hypothetical protein N7488_006514 [Penicillium malachiteum]|nr:hypothetical protein N7488_006514 [Penicillium malachiteum]